MVVIPALAISLKQFQQGLAVVYSSALSIITPFFAACRMAFASAWMVATQWPPSRSWPTSSQWGMPRIDPLYPVDRIVLSRTITAPTCLRSQVERLATWRAMFMKYVCQSTRRSTGFVSARFNRDLLHHHVLQ